MKKKQRIMKGFLIVFLAIFINPVDIATAQKTPSRNPSDEPPPEEEVKKVPGSKIVFFADSFDFGQIPENRRVTHIFRFKNTGTAPLLVARYLKSKPVEGCWSADLVVGSTTVKPGETGTIYVSVIMHKGMGGPHLFHIFVRNSDPENRVIILKVKADIVPLETWRRSHPGAFYLPREVAGFKLGSESVGIEVIPESLKAFGYPEELKYAYLGKYGKNKKNMRLLAAEYIDVGTAKKNFSKMVERLENIAKKSNQLIKRDVAGNTVYSFKKGAKENLYFQIADKVFLLFVEGSVATQSLEDVLKHIQAQ